MSARTRWEFEADYLTICNCDWGCPCNFNARPTRGNCEGWGAWRIHSGRFGDTSLDGAVFAMAVWWPGPIAQGGGTARLYLDVSTTPAQRAAIETIAAGREGGGIFEIFATTFARTYPPRVVPIELAFDGLRVRLRVEGAGEADTDVLRYPDGTEIRPTFSLPHGIEFKMGTAANARRWWMRDEALLAYHEDKYAAIARVRFSEAGCLA